MKFIYFYVFYIAFSPCLALAKLNILTTTTDLAFITKEIAKNLAEVSSLALGTQEPHHIEIKPSYVFRAAKSDLIISIGIGYESSWLLPVCEKSNNSKIKAGASGNLEIAPSISLLQDSHPQGNPHFLLDPIRAAQAGELIAARLGLLDPSNELIYKKNAMTLTETLTKKTEEWKKAISLSGTKKVVTYHRSLDYFFDRFDIEVVATIEASPGVPPSAKHIVSVINKIKAEGVTLVLLETNHSTKSAEKIKESIEKIQIRSVFTQIGSNEKIQTIFELYENLVQAVIL